MADTATKTASAAPLLPGTAAAESVVQQMEFIGQFAGAMANQLNNIMMAITSSAELELRRGQLADKRALENVLANAARATSLIHKLLAFSRHPAPSPQPLRLNAAISDCAVLIRQLTGEQIEVSLRLEPTVHRVWTDESEIEHTLVALALHAAGRGTSRMAIATDLANLDANFLASSEDACPGKYVVLSIDVAEDISQIDVAEPGANPTGTQHAILDPLISPAAAIARAAGGVLRVSRSASEGASFKIYFPALGKEAPDQPTQSMPKQTPSATILIVEDDDGVRLPAAEFLKMEGYKILQARTGAEALHIALRHRSAIDLLITDIVMPEMNGHTVAASLLEIYPEIKLLYMSGDPNQKLVGKVVEEERPTALQKPFSLNTLHRRVQDLLGH